MRREMLIALVTVGLSAGIALAEPPKGVVALEPIKPEDAPDAPKGAVAAIEAKSGSHLSGKAVFVQEGASVKLRVDVENAPPGTHAIHLHEKGDCSAPDAMSAGPHWNPTKQAHGKWGQTPFHHGDIGNIEVGSDGRGTASLTTELWSVGGNPETDVVGKSIVVHANADDFQTQPTGNAGGRIGCGVVVRENR